MHLVPFGPPFLSATARSSQHSLGIKYLISLLSEGINLSLLCFLLLAETIINFNATLSGFVHARSISKSIKRLLHLLCYSVLQKVTYYVEWISCMRLLFAFCKSGAGL